MESDERLGYLLLNKKESLEKFKKKYSKKRIRILHAPYNYAGQPSTIAEAQKKLGVISDVMVFSQSFLNYKIDKDLQYFKKPRLLRPFYLLFNFFRCLIKYDVFHFHSAGSLLYNYLDIRILKFFRKKIIMHYWGSDIRQGDIAEKFTLLHLKEHKGLFSVKADLAKRKKIQKIDNLVKVSIVSACLQPYAPKALILNQAIDLSRFRYIGCENKNKKVKIVHAPTNRKTKGSKYVFSAFKRLLQNGYNCDLVLIKSKTNEEVHEICRQADIVVDQLLSESYGIFALEAMALGKPVICRMDKAFLKYYPNLPIINADPEILYDSLKMLIRNHNLRKKIGEKSRKYVEDRHDSVKIAKKLLRLYSII